MAWLEFYIQTTGDDRNAGSTLDDAASVSQTGTTSNVSTGVTRFTASSGTPFNSASHLNQRVSLYNTGDAAARFVGKIMNVDTSGPGGTGAYIEIYNDLATGANLDCLGKGDVGTPTSSLSTAAGGTACKIGGAWASLGITATNFAMSVVTAATVGSKLVRVNIKSGTYANSTARTISAGNGNYPVWWRGYSSTIGDLDDVANASGRPEFTFTGTANLTVNQYNLLENLKITSTTGTASTLVAGATLAYDIRFHRCRISHQGGSAYTSGGGVAQFSACYLEAKNSSTCLVVASSTAHVVGCMVKAYSQGTATGVGVSVANGSVTIAHSIISGTFLGVNSTGNGQTAVLNCTIYNTTSHGFNATSSVLGLHTVANTIFSVIGGYCINVATTQNGVFNLLNNDYHSYSSGIYNNIVDVAGTAVDHKTQTETSSPFVTPGTDFTLKNDATYTAKALQAGFPGQFEV